MAQEYSFEEIERYLDGDMDTAETEHFEKLLSVDSNLARRVKEQKNAHDMVELYARDVVKDRVKSIYDNTKKRQTKSSNGFSIMKIAASIALVASIGILYSYIVVNYNTQNLAGNAFEPYPNRFRTMGENEQSAFNRGLIAYDRQNYPEAMIQFSSVASEDEKHLDASFYLGVAYLGSKQYEKALSSFQLVIAENSLYESAAKWYLSLVYLHLGREEDAKNMLQDIIDRSDVKSQAAKELLDDLNSNLRRLPFVR